MITKTQEFNLREEIPKWLVDKSKGIIDAESVPKEGESVKGMFFENTMSSMPNACIRYTPPKRIETSVVEKVLEIDKDEYFIQTKNSVYKVFVAE